MVEEKVKEILLNVLDVKAEDIVAEASFLEDLQATSIDLVEIFTAIQNTFDLEISPEQAAQLKTVKDVVDFLKAELADKGAVS